MDLMLGQPMGLWMLLGIPVVLAIHFLQSRAQRVEISTLFLLDHLPEENRKGAVFQRLRHSIPLWLQLLAVLLATLLLAKPLLLRADTLQSVVFVMDASYSMSAFTSGARDALDRETRRLERATARTAWYAISSDPARPALYAGDDRLALLDAIAMWTPDSGEHDPAAALARAKDLTGPQGLVVFVTDHEPAALPPYVSLLAVGEPFDQAGFVGAQTWPAAHNALHWRVALMHYGAESMDRTWTMEADGVVIGQTTLRLEPGRVRVLEGTTPTNVSHARLTLHADRFSLDDTVYLVRPQKPILRMASTVQHAPSRAWAERLMSTLPDISPVTAPEDAHVVWTETPGDRSAMVFHRGSPSDKATFGDVLAESHPLLRDLVWHDFTGQVLPGTAPAPDEQVLLWMNEQPLVLLRGAAPNQQLHFRFHMEDSNATRHPGMILLIARFLEQIRASIPGTETGLAELNQSMAHTGAAFARAPALPGWFTIEHNGAIRFDGAANFTETREADFRNASSRNDLVDVAPERARVLRRHDPFAPLWLALLGLAIFGSWYAATRERSRAS